VDAIRKLRRLVTGSSEISSASRCGIGSWQCISRTVWRMILLVVVDRVLVVADAFSAKNCQPILGSTLVLNFSFRNILAVAEVIVNDLGLT
jgi:hypothetical protein